MNNKTKGFIYGAIAAASYGMNPLFTLPLYAAGMSVDTVLFYRYVICRNCIGCLDEAARAVFYSSQGRHSPLGNHGIAVFVFISASIHELQLYGCRYCFYHSVRLSGDGSCDHGRLFQREDFRNHRFFDPVGTFGHCPALSGRWQQTTLHRRNYLCFTVVSLLCHLYRRSQPVFIKNITDYQTDFLCYIIRIIGLHSPLEFLHGIANHTLSLIVGRCSGLGHSPHCRVIDLHRISHSIYRLHSYCYTRCSGACDSVIFGVLLFHEN